MPYNLEQHELNYGANMNPIILPSIMSGARPCIVTSPMQRVLDMKRSADRSNNLHPAGKTGKM